MLIWVMVINDVIIIVNVFSIIKVLEAIGERVNIGCNLINIQVLVDIIIELCIMFVGFGFFMVLFN